MKSILAIQSILAASLVLAACAGNGRGGPAMTMQPNQQISPPVGLMLVGLDSNQDTIVSGEEINAGIAAMFELSDTDQSGDLTGIEFAQWSEKQLGNAQTTPGRLRFDRNQNNRISSDEFDSTIKAMVARFDRDGDGALARAELLMTVNAPDTAAMRAEMESQMRSRARQMCQRMGRGR